MLINHIEKLAYFYEIARFKSYRRASEELNITQPSLSKSMKLLEEALETELFVRVGRGIDLTTAGKILFEFSKELKFSLSGVEATIKQLEDPLQGHLRIGTYDSIAIYFWPHFLAQLKQDFPKLSIELLTGRSHEVFRLLHEGLIDLAVIIGFEGHPGTYTIHLGDDYFAWYGAPQGRGQKVKTTTPALILMQEVLADTEYEELRELEKSGQTQVYRTSSLESAKSLAAAGLGYAFLPSMVVREQVAKKSLKKQNLPYFQRLQTQAHSINLHHRAKSRQTALIKTFLAELTQAEL